MLLKKYTSNWIKNFEVLCNEIQKGLVNVEYRIEHIGSTSVPNLDAKDIIDLVIIHQSESEFKKIKNGLIDLGYFHNGNQGIEQREVFKRTGEINNPILDQLTHHLYVCPEHSTALEENILFRDFLRKNEWARIRYQEMKYDLAERSGQNRKLYANLKELNMNEFIDEIVNLEKRSNETTYPPQKKSKD